MKTEENTKKEEMKNEKTAGNAVVFENPEFGKIRTLTDEDGEPLFCAKDVCDVLGYKNQRDAIQRHVDDPCVVKHDVWVDMSLILVVEVTAEVLLASALASEITATTFVALEATTLVAFLETLSVALATEVTATLAVALEAAAATLVIVVIIASTATDT